MSGFFVEQGRTKVFGEAYFLYAATGSLRRTPLSGKIAIYWMDTNYWQEISGMKASMAMSSLGRATRHDTV
jgi:hypothetical protein